jgi:hypothetical protein
VLKAILVTLRLSARKARKDTADMPVILVDTEHKDTQDIPVQQEHKDLKVLLDMSHP